MKVYTGMTLRDWFAGQALAGYVHTLPGDGFFTFADVADKCYRAADAMLKERAK